MRISALTVRVRSATSPPLVRLDLLLQPREAPAPEHLELGLEALEGIAVRQIEASGAVASLVDQAGGAQHRQVLRDRRTADVEVRGDVAGRALRVPDEA